MGASLEKMPLVSNRVGHSGGPADVLTQLDRGRDSLNDRLPVRRRRIDQGEVIAVGLEAIDRLPVRRAPFGVAAVDLHQVRTVCEPQSQSAPLLPPRRDRPPRPRKHFPIRERGARTRDLRRARPAPLLDVTRLRQTGAVTRPHSTGLDSYRRSARTALAPLLPVVETAPRKVLQMEFSGDGAYRDRTGDLRLANPPDSPTPPDTDRQNRHD